MIPSLIPACHTEIRSAIHDTRRTSEHHSLLTALPPCGAKRHPQHVGAGPFARPNCTLHSRHQRRTISADASLNRQSLSGERVEPAVPPVADQRRFRLYQ